ncbi:MAG: beta-lactamase family protein [Deltaproteobacteria bacterium]|nr:beta-lactamase family protein [Deltaproteobacteria bacterium]
MSNSWPVLDEILQQGLRHQVFTGAALLVGLKGELRYEAAVGQVDQTPEAAPVHRNTFFDLASLTKPLATGLALLTLMAAGRLQLTTTLGEILPGDWLPHDKLPLTLGSLLTHSAGLPAWRPFYQTILVQPPEQRPGMLEKLAAAEPLEYPPGTATVYSDLGFMLLKGVIETASGQDLDSFCREQLYIPLGLPGLGFCPRSRPGGDKRDYAATETGLIPERSIRGEVHDENAWAAGGIAGHAGLFGRGWEVFRLLAALYQSYQGKTPQFFHTPWVRTFLTPAPGSTRTLGFDTPATSNSSAGRFFSPHSVGHTGFTGTSFWLDLELGQMVVLLTNRVHLGRDNDKIKQFRPRIHEAASRALGFEQVFRG